MLIQGIAGKQIARFVREGWQIDKYEVLETKDFYLFLEEKANDLNKKVRKVTCSEKGQAR